jgi:hypothetical protein
MISLHAVVPACFCNRKNPVAELHGSWPKWSRIGQPSFRYGASVQELFFAATVICAGALTVVLVATVLFWH